MLLGSAALPSDGAAVTQWNDVSGNARHAAQAVAADQPVFETAVQNSLPVVRFAVASTQMLETGVALAQPFTVVAVISVVDTAANRSVVQGSTAATGDAAFFINTLEQVTSYGGSSVSDTSGAITGFTVIAGVVDNASTWAYNGGDGTNQTGVTGTGGTRTMTNVQIGAGPALANPFDGDIAEIIIYSSALSLANRNIVGTELKTRWNATWTNAGS
jgi:hypothetical protein